MAVLKTAHQHCCIFDRHCRTLPHVRLHWMTAIAQQTHAPLHPARLRRSFEKGPFRHLSIRHIDEALTSWMKSDKGLTEFVLAACRPAHIARPILHYARPQINLISPMRHKIDYQVAVGSPPFCQVVDFEIAQPVTWKYHAVADVAAVDWPFCAQHPLAHIGMDPICADDYVSARGAAVRKFHGDRGCILIESDETLA